MKRFIGILLVLCLLPGAANAWWNADWKNRMKITLVTTPEGADIKATVGPVPVAVRLHSANFLFTDAKPDGSDIRFIAGDDKTPLKHFIETYDVANQLAVIWVQIPHLAGGSMDSIWMYSGNEKVGSAEEPKAVYDTAQVLALNFGETQGPFKDSTAYASPLVGEGVAFDANGLAGGSARFSGRPLRVDASPSITVKAGGGATFSAWVRPASAQSAQLFSWGPWSVDLAGGKVSARLEKSVTDAVELKAATWSHLAVTISDRLVLYVNGKEAASSIATPADVGGPMLIGQGLEGQLDVVGVASVARPAAWFAVEAAQGPDGKLLAYGEPEATDNSGSGSYIAILLRALTPDAKVVIGILGVMFIIAIGVMFNKAVLVARTDKGNVEFLADFVRHPLEFLNPGSKIANSAEAHPHSSIARLYRTGIRELRHRVNAKQGALSAESVAAIKASIDSTLIRENQSLNRRMVLLTIAISGGPFLGLLGTVVGVMITFAAIAAQGDVNINAIAPGIAAALLATVAGLAVAIPSLFGYNYLITRIKAITADMQAFTDEFIAKMAEAHNA
jgi:biopolymer transport protein ExbB